jgi:hypothetical protein
MLVKIHKLKETALDWAAAQAMGIQVTICMPNKYPNVLRVTGYISQNWAPSGDAYQCAHIIDAKKISVVYHELASANDSTPTLWSAYIDPTRMGCVGVNRSQADLRALVASHFGTDEVNVPDELVCREDLCE